MMQSVDLKVLGKAEPSKVPGKAEPPKVPVKAEPHEVWGKVQTPKIPGKAEPPEVLGKGQTPNVPGKAEPPKVLVRAAPLQKYRCTVEDCGASFSRGWRLNEHYCTHTGERRFCCTHPGCERRFDRRDNLKNHKKGHAGVKPFVCPGVNCKAAFNTRYRLRKHTRRSHGQEEKCPSPGCERVFRKKWALMFHLQEHGGFPFEPDGGGMELENLATGRAHHRKRGAYPCPIEDCKTVSTTWKGCMEHLKTHSVEYNCLLCDKTFKTQKGLSRHGVSHGPDKPVLMCPREDCKADFSTVSSLQHHIKKDHLKVLKHRCYFPGCDKTFIRRTSMSRHLIVHDADRKELQLQPRRAKRSWKRRWHSLSREPLVEDNASHLINQKQFFCFKTKVETDLTGLYNERKMCHGANSAVNLQTRQKLPNTKESEKAV